jgi:hypothetical protein
MYNPNAVRNIVSAHVAKLNRNSNFYLKVFLYSTAVVAFFVLMILNHPTAAKVVSVAIALLTLFGFGLPIGVFMEEFERRLVPDDIYMAIKKSKEIEPELLAHIRHFRSPELTVSELISIEKEYHKVKKITSAPGYRSLDEDEPETN